jgi:hypothetical protein
MKGIITMLVTNNTLPAINRKVGMRSSAPTSRIPNFCLGGADEASPAGAASRTSKAIATPLKTLSAPIKYKPCRQPSGVRENCAISGVSASEPNEVRLRNRPYALPRSSLRKWSAIIPFAIGSPATVPIAPMAYNRSNCS